jgi:membrane protease YdiL (CAAX protease family)
VPHAFLEESYWRWFVFGQLRQFMAWPLAAGISGLAFALHHVIVLGSYLPPENFWTVTVFFSLCVAVGGALWAWIYQRSGSLYGPWLSHLLIDVGVMAIGFDLCRRYWT